jgi:FAD:protein FMN transferase
MQENIILKSERNFNMLGGNISIIIYDIDELLLEDIYEDIHKEGLRLQKIFNLYDKDSELSRLNLLRRLDVSPELLEVLNRAMHYAKITDGAYDISLGQNMLRRKKAQELKELKCSYKDISIEENVVELKHEDVLIDLGSIAKGYIADSLIGFMKNLGIENGFIDARGDMRIFGDFNEIIEVQHPRDEDKGLHKMILADMSVATSGDYKQFHESFENNHIIGSLDVISTTVIADNLMDADAAATCLFVIGLANTKRFMDDNKQLKAFVIDKDLNEYFFNGFDKLIVDDKDMIGIDGA